MNAQQTKDLAELAALNDLIDDHDANLMVLAKHREVMVKRRDVLHQRLRGNRPLVLSCLDCPAEFHLDQVSRLLGHTIEKHSRRPYALERTPVEP